MGVYVVHWGIPYDRVLEGWYCFLGIMGMNMEITTSFELATCMDRGAYGKVSPSLCLNPKP